MQSLDLRVRAQACGSETPDPEPSYQDHLTEPNAETISGIKSLLRSVTPAGAEK